MVRYYSDDGVFDAPVAKVWALNQAHDEHGGEIHPNILSSKGTPRPDGTVMAEWVTKDPDGTKANHQLRLILRPPHALSIEFIEGPLKGSWVTNTYVPEGDKTRVVTVAEWRVQGVTDEAILHRMATEYFDTSYDEDTRYLKTMK